MTVARLHAVGSESELRRVRELRSIVRRAHRFELGPLVYALEQAGVPLSRIYFDARSLPNVRGQRHPMRLAPEGRVVVGATLRSDPVGLVERVVIHLSQGLFGARSPLPTYFHSLLCGEVLASTLGDLLHVLDDSLWRGRVAPEYVRRELRSTTLDQHLGEATSGTDPLYLDWLFRQVFPELRVEVQRSSIPRAVRLDSVFLGHVALGVCALSGNTALPTDALVVTLTTAFDTRGSKAESVTAEGDTWSREVELRLGRDVLPLFERRPLSLRVVLRVLASRTQSKVARSRLGEALVVNARPPFEFTVFEGTLGSVRM